MSHLTSTPSVPELIADAFVWERRVDDWWVNTTGKIVVDGWYPVRMDALQQVHPLLPVLLDGFAEHGDAAISKNQVRSAIVRATLHHWTAPHIPLRDDSNNANIHPGYLLEIQKIKRMSNAFVAPVEVSAIALDIVEYKVMPASQLHSPTAKRLLPPTLDVAFHSYFNTWYVSRVWMDTYFPGWETRLDLATELGCTTREIGTLVSQTHIPVSPTSALPDIAFE